MAAATAYRANAIPIDGLHIDVDFQDNYRTFTSSKMKFGDIKSLFDELHGMGFKCSTNITALISANPQDEQGNDTPYPTRDEGLANGYFVYNTRAEGGESPEFFMARESYGSNPGTNPYTYPPLTPDASGATPLGAAGYYPNLGDPKVQQWWGQQYKQLLDAGLDMIWQDMTCPATEADVTPAEGSSPSYQELMSGVDDVPDDATSSMPLDLMLATPDGTYQPNAVVHNGYALLLCQATWNGINTLRPDKRNFIIARGGYAGLQRYAGLWTGDSASSWEFLQINIPEVLNLGLSGQPMSGCDIGGFANGSGSSNGYFDQGTRKMVGCITDPELFVRWMNLGAFLPWYRNHYDGYTKQYQEPYAYGEPYLSYCRKYIQLRYRLLQVFYDAMYQATKTGLPIARALFLNFPNDVNSYTLNNGQYLNDQFFLGDNLLVAPIVQQGAVTRNIYLPQGADWYAFQDESSPLLSPVAGGTEIGVSEGTTPYYAPLGEVPLYVRAGAILPMLQVQQWVGELARNPITFQIYPGPDSTYTLYQDDGVTTAAQKQGSYRLTQISHTATGNGQSIRVQRTQDKYTPPEPYYLLALLGCGKAPSSVTSAGASFKSVQDQASLQNSTQNAWYYAADTQIVYVKVFDTSADVTVNVAF
jgi:alpha-glucosidase